MAKPVSVQHLAGGPIAGIQRCERCGMVLIDHSAAPKPLFGTFRFWQTGASVYAKPSGMWSMLAEKTFQRCLSLKSHIGANEPITGGYIAGRPLLQRITEVFQAKRGSNEQYFR